MNKDEELELLRQFKFEVQEEDQWLHDECLKRAQTYKTGHLMTCRVCGRTFHMDMLNEVFEHQHAGISAPMREGVKVEEQQTNTFDCDGKLHKIWMIAGVPLTLPAEVPIPDDAQLGNLANGVQELVMALSVMGLELTHVFAVDKSKARCFDGSDCPTDPQACNKPASSICTSVGRVIIPGEFQGLSEPFKKFGKPLMNITDITSGHDAQHDLGEMGKMQADHEQHGSGDHLPSDD